MAETRRYDLVVIGGGPGGYPAAVHAAQMGLRVALVEARALGGECTNYGCIPTKALRRIALAADIVSSVGRVELERGKLIREAMRVVDRIRAGIEQLLEGYDIDVIRARARLRPGGIVEAGNLVLEAEKVVLAPGTEPWSPPGLEPDGRQVHDNRSFLSLEELPQRLLIVGGGPIGVEYADIMARLGVEVYLVELMPRLLPGMDRDLSLTAKRWLRSLGVKVYTSTRIARLERGKNNVEAVLENGERIETDAVLVATGRRPSTHGMGLEEAGVELDEKGYIKVDDYMATSAPGVYAAGDAAGPPLLAHKAMAQSIVAGVNAAGGKAVYKQKAVPMVVYMEPELAQVGYTLEEARKAGLDAAETRIRLGGIASAVMEGAEAGLVKIVYEERSLRVLGVVAAAPRASEFIAEVALAVEKGVTLEELASVVHPHPSVSEALQEVAEVALGRPTHYMTRRVRRR
ncbi:Dihydrolipoamide dehydrogenase [Pyrodictium delaneyi]|uniref:Dihydrolipoyl dehydrogenase n=1 Tax=Pyrodictium delaneyi TaxID=1273541 RepID=A0A0P0N2W6_9CREN|nr:dihydrolipoyl dehydrogenase [Pyrodictium delaneyi]ALL00988.1 Dihydrolipoamide dehydrogenase [Pyrodictium delaneyi]OWJ55407.1 dihydrolipoyl dehydrogenase [Pyrodictium delaneyi]